MRTTNRSLLALLATLVAMPLAAQDIPGGGTTQGGGSAPRDTTPEEVPAGTPAAISVVIGSPAAGRIGEFEPAKQSTEFRGMQLAVGGSFAQSWQSLSHENDATPAPATTLGEIRSGFVLASANLNIGAQLARGIRVDMESYMASRHYNYFWVKGGYATIDASPINVPILNQIMEYATIRAGHMEINYGDAHYRRTDGGNSIRNPFVENYILDGFTTEIGAEVLVRGGPFGSFAMVGVTSGENKGNIKDGAVDASPAVLGKVGFDNRIGEGLRFRLTGSIYNSSSSPAMSLYGGDRSGSRYWGVLEDTATLKGGAAFTNGRINPGFSNEVTAYMINPYLEVGGLELFGVIERARGQSAAESERREVNHLAADAVYHLMDDRLYVGARWNRLSGDWSRQTDLTVTRRALAAGWFITPNMLTKIEYVNQDYDGFGPTDIRSGAGFNGLVIEGIIAF
jgi:hypothetical protein